MKKNCCFIIFCLCVVFSAFFPLVEGMTWNNTAQVEQVSLILDQMETRIRETIQDKRSKINSTISDLHVQLEEKRDTFKEVEALYHEKHGEALGEKNAAIHAAEKAFEKAMKQVEEIKESMVQAKDNLDEFKDRMPQATQNANDEFNSFFEHMQSELNLIAKIRDILGLIHTRNFKGLHEACNDHFGCQEGLVCEENICRSESGRSCETTEDCSGFLECTDGRCLCDVSKAVFEENGNQIHSGQLQEWEVPNCAHKVKIEAWGAQGGGSRGGLGAFVSGEFEISAEAKLKIVVGKRGGVTSQYTDFGAGGGGGSFVFVSESDPMPLLVAAGGGGQSRDADGAPGSHTLEPVNSLGRGNGQAGSNGQGGSGGPTQGLYSSAGGGSGWLTNGEDGQQLRNPKGLGGKSPRNGASGGQFSHPNYNGADGGFGGGGSGSDNSGAGGGGGGFNGGGGGGNYLNQLWGAGGGGGSYNGGINKKGKTGENSGHGKVIITAI